MIFHFLLFFGSIYDAWGPHPQPPRDRLSFPTKEAKEVCFSWEARPKRRLRRDDVSLKMAENHGLLITKTMVINY